MQVKELLTFSGGWMKEKFVMGGSRKENIDVKRKYGYDIRSYLIEVNGEVILIDTSFPEHISDFQANPYLGIDLGKRVQSFMSALEKAGYQVEDVDKIILTHGDIDHAGMIENFPNATIIMSKYTAERLGEMNLKKMETADFQKGDYMGFQGAYEVSTNVYFVSAPGHTNGHGIVIAFDENDEVYYMFAGDTTVSDQALNYAEVLIVHEDIEAAKDSLKKIRKFIQMYPTIYLTAHEPESHNSLLEKRIMNL